MSYCGEVEALRPVLANVYLVIGPDFYFIYSFTAVLQNLLHS